MAEAIGRPVSWLLDQPLELELWRRRLARGYEPRFMRTARLAGQIGFLMESYLTGQAAKGSWFGDEGAAGDAADDDRDEDMRVALEGFRGE